jgi:hypothetical protein
MKAYSDDLRVRIIKAYKQYPHQPYSCIANRFYVSRTFVRELISLYVNTGDITPHSKRNHFPKPVKVTN